MKNKLNLKRWLSILLAVIFVVPAALSLTGVISIRAVLSDSMAPKINVGDVVVTANWQKPGLNEVAIYHQRDISGDVKQDVVHRVITISSAGEYQFKGDNNEAIDALTVDKKDIVGTVFMKVPFIGGLFTPVGLISLVLFIGGLYAVLLGIRKFRQQQNEAE